jgi:phosphoserine phosphatase
LPTKKYVLITVRGHDAPGITRDLSGILDLHKATLVDVEQVVIHDLLLLSFLVAFPTGAGAKTALAQLREIGSHRDLIIEEEQQRRSLRHTYVVTLLAPTVSLAALQGVAGVLAGQGANIEKIHKLTDGDVTVIELVVRNWSRMEPLELKRGLLEANDRYGIEIAVQRESIFRRSKRLVVMDMDSTLIGCEVIDELAAVAGRRDEVAAVTEAAMRGELDFSAALRKRVQALKGLPVESLQEVASRVPLTPGAEVLIKVLRRLGYKTAVISGGFTYFTEDVQKRLGLDYAFANELDIADGRLTGKVRGRIVDADVKAELLEDIARREKLGLDQVIAIGDGANDLKMLSRAGLGIAFNAKRRVREAAHGTLSGSLDSILYMLGITQRDMEELTSAL